MESCADVIGIRHRGDGIVGTDHGTHAATHASVGHISVLPDSHKRAVRTAALFFKDIKIGHPLTPVSQIDCLCGANGRALPAECTAVFPVLYDPGKITICQAAWRRGYGSN